MKLRHLAAVCLLSFASAASFAQSDPASVTIGVLNDMSGTFADQSGPGSAVAAQIAVDQFGSTVLGKPIKIITGDHQNKADVAAGIARRWYDNEGVQMVVDLPNSSTALAVQEVAKQAKKINVVATAGSLALTGKSCSPTGFHWMWDTYSNSYGLVKAIAKNKLDGWYFITADYAFGHGLEADFRKAIAQQGGKVLGASKHPVGMQDFSSLILSAQASGARAIVVANGGNDIVNTLKAADAFGLQKAGIAFVAPAMFLTDLKSIGLDIGQGLTYISAFAWTLDDQSRAFAQKFFDRHKAMPAQGQAGTYSAVRHYLRAVTEAKTLNGPTVAEKMRSMPVNDAVVRNGKIRADGRVVKDMYLVEARKPGEAKDPWDLEKIHDTLAGDEMFRPLSESDCPVVTR